MSPCPLATGWSLIALGALSTCATHTGHTLLSFGHGAV